MTSNSSTVSLRGRIKFESSTAGDSDATTKSKPCWTWEGRWAFGNSVLKARSLPMAKRGPTASQPRTQPFLYRFVGGDGGDDDAAREPRDVKVPSLNFLDPNDDDDDDESVGGKVDATEVRGAATTGSATGTVAGKESTKPVSTTTSSSYHDAPTTTAVAASTSKDTQATTTNTSDEQIHSSSPPLQPSTTIFNTEVKQSEEEGIKKANDAEKNPKVDRNHASTTPPTEKKSTDLTNAQREEDPTTSTDTANATTIATILKDSVPRDAAKDEEQTKQTATTATTTTMKEKKQPITFASVMPGFTDAYTKYNNNDNGGGDGRDGSSSLAKVLLPHSGQWTGYFENIAGRDKKKQKLVRQKIEERFCLFLNATPSDDAKFGFEEDGLDYGVVVVDDDDDDKKKNNYGDGGDVEMKIVSSSRDTSGMEPGVKRPSNLVQIRGCGENQFGDFEIFGFLNVDTMIMEIQRQYVFPPEATIKSSRSSSTSSPSATSRQNKSGSDTPTTSSRPTSTRKRQPSWKRMSTNQEEDEQRERRKKVKLQQQQLTKSQSQHSTTDKVVSITPATVQAPTSSTSGDATKKDDTCGTAVTSDDGKIDTANVLGGSLPVAASVGDLQPAPLTIIPKRNADQPQSSAMPMPMKLSSTTGSIPSSRSGLTSLKISLPSQLAGTSSTASTPTTMSKSSTGKRSSTGGRSKRSSPGGALGSASRSSKGGSASSTPVPPPSNIRLPPAGDPKKARWRAPHFLYYQRHDQTETSSNIDGGGSSPKAAPPPATPKYVIYTGEMADGKREGRGLCLYNNGTLYQGFWKKGKEHGYGTIMTADRRRVIFEGNFERGKMSGFGTYYYASSGEAIVSRYIGEFRENQRNGMGRYVWSDGSEFNGNWSQDQMTHGTFTWPDGSTYMGGFKDSKRSGPGILRASDGFIYDGMWDNNAMEGRGLAIYPSGQRFEGLFSKGRREGRGTIFFTNGAVYEGRFRDDAVDGQGTMKMTQVAIVPRDEPADPSDGDEKEVNDEAKPQKADFMIPISFASDITHIHTRAGFTAHGE